MGPFTGRFTRAFCLIVFLFSLVLWTIRPTARAAAVADEEFTFISWGDSQTEDENATLRQLAFQAANLQPDFTIFNGDLAEWGFSQRRMALWKGALEDAGLFQRTFPVRGNHDPEFPDQWKAFFDLQAASTLTGAANLIALEEDLTYSFDYGWAHFVGIDLIYGIADALTPTQVAWLDADLTAAEARGQTQSFLFMHDSPYCVGWADCECKDRVCQPTTVPVRQLVSVLNRHPSLKATFHGHNHVQAYVHIDSTRIPEVTHPWEQFHTSPAGLKVSIAKDRRVDWYESTPGFARITVRPNGFQIEFYALDGIGPFKTLSFFDPVPPTGTPAQTATQTITPTLPNTETNQPTATATLPGAELPALTPTPPVEQLAEQRIFLPWLGP